MPEATPFALRVYETVRTIPPGRVTSYGGVAAMLGQPRAARAVGAALNALLPEEHTDVPWWRVVNHRGLLTIPPELGLRTLQRTLLESESVGFRSSGAVDMDAHGWWPDEDEVD